MSKGKIKPTLKYYFANSFNFAINKDCKWEENAQNENKLSESWHMLCTVYKYSC